MYFQTSQPTHAFLRADRCVGLQSFRFLESASLLSQSPQVQVLKHSYINGKVMQIRNVALVVLQNRGVLEEKFPFLLCCKDNAIEKDDDDASEAGDPVRNLTLRHNLQV